MATPTWLAATTGQTAQAGQDNQFLGTHAITYIAGAETAGRGVDGSAAIGVSNGPPASGFRRVAQSFTSANNQYSLGYIGMYLKKTGNGCDLSLSIYSNSGGVPNAALTLVGSVTVVTLPADFITTSLAWVYIPLPLVTSGSVTYWIVAQAGDINGNNAGDASNYISFEKSDQASGAATYTTTWASQSYGFMFWVYNMSTAASPLIMVYEDGGARWTSYGYSRGGAVNMPTSPAPISINEYTVSQGTGQMRSARSITYSGGVS